MPGRARGFAKKRGTAPRRVGLLVALRRMRHRDAPQSLRSSGEMLRGGESEAIKTMFNDTLHTGIVSTDSSHDCHALMPPTRQTRKERVAVILRRVCNALLARGNPALVTHDPTRLS